MRAATGLNVFVLLTLSACSTLPPGAHYPKTASVTRSSPDQTQLGQHIQAAAQAHGERTGFRIISVGVDGFVTRLEIINAAQRTLDLQYYIFHGDETGRLITEALARAANRGVHVRVLVDDAETKPGDEQLFDLASTPGVEIRVYNPWAYRGHLKVIRNIEFLTHRRRLDYRMHNKLLVADNAFALVGGRNIGDQYFQVDPQSQFADDDVFAAGPVVQELERDFDQYWNSDLSIPSAALGHGNRESRRHGDPAQSRTPDDKLRQAGFDYTAKLATGQPLMEMLSNGSGLLWANAKVLCDSPDKRKVTEGSRTGSLLYAPVAEAVNSVHRELLMMTPYFVPTQGELRLLSERRAASARVAILTNSLQSAPELAAHAGYMHYRPALLGWGVELYEVRSRLQSTRGSGQSARISRYGNYSLHGKLIVFDRDRLFVGSMNFDRRSRYLNTEVGLLIDSPELSEQIASRFRAMTQPASAFAVLLRPQANGRGTRLLWKTREGDRIVEYEKEPARSAWQRLRAHIVSLLPLDPEL